MSTTFRPADSERLRRLSQCMRMVGRATAVEQVAEVLVRALKAGGFHRARVSWVKDSTWSPDGIEYVPLRPGSHESEMLRRRRAAVVTDATTSRPPERAIVVSLRSSEYVAAPLVSEGRVVGLVHACAAAGIAVDEMDRSFIEALAEFSGQTLSRIAAQERVETVRRSVQRFADGMTTTVDSVCNGATSTQSNVPVVPVLGEGRLIELLTPRELEVLRLMAGGETNGQIAVALTISQSTVKSHVKQVLRKMHAANRAQAVARYLRVVHRRQAA